MAADVLVNFGVGREYAFRLQDPDLAGGNAEEARRWLDEQYGELGCEPANPMGKVLLVDRIIGVARALGHRAFENRDERAGAFVRNVALALDRPTIRVDVAGSSIGY